MAGRASAHAHSWPAGWFWSRGVCDVTELPARLKSARKFKFQNLGPWRLAPSYGSLYLNSVYLNTSFYIFVFVFYCVYVSTSISLCMCSYVRPYACVAILCVCILSTSVRHSFIASPSSPLKPITRHQLQEFKRHLYISNKPT